MVDESPAVPAWGVTEETMMTFGSFDFEPYMEGTTTATTFATTRRHLTAAPVFPFLIKTFSPPQGALITRVRVLFCNTSGTTALMNLHRMNLDGTADFFGAIHVPANSGCTATEGAFNVTVDATSGPYTLLMGLNTLDDTQALVGMQVFYRLQVSPSPGVATFTDVPTGHSLFQYVEALAAAGITGGCGGGNYCPNDPVTRGQMAVFLAKALGLHWAP